MVSVVVVVTTSVRVVVVSARSKGDLALWLYEGGGGPVADLGRPISLEVLGESISASVKWLLSSRSRSLRHTKAAHEGFVTKTCLLNDQNIYDKETGEKKDIPRWR